MLGKASIEQSPHNYFGIFSALQNGKRQGDPVG